MMLDWTDPTSWPPALDLADMSEDFQVLMQDHYGVNGGEFPVIGLLITDVYVPPMDYEDDRNIDENGDPSDQYIEALTRAMAAGERFPPIVVGGDDGGRGKRWGYPLDGRHRLNAAVRLGLTIVPAFDMSEYE